ncbi:MAG TPA: FtsK/SpoIIIE domain-containing protein, partial [Ktedonobacteraceae bacterium]|nr:FtsK/SpoIIIE domain-containing protein [Ktedonobacteraceae bacterium]
ADDDEQSSMLDEWTATMARTLKVDKQHKAQPIRLLPEYVRADYFLMDIISSMSMQQKVESASVPQIRLGIEDFSLNPISVELNNEMPHMMVVGGPGSGRTTVVQTSLLMLASPNYRNAKVVLVDFRRSSRPFRRLPTVWMYADTEERLIDVVNTLKQELQARVTQMRAELRRMEEADDDDLTNLHMDPIIIAIDDYEQLAALARNPLLDLREFLLQARDLNLHIIVTGSPADIMRSDALLQQVRACRHGLILGADPNDQQILGVRMSDLPPGRGHLVRRNQRNLIQVAHLATSNMLPWLTRLVQAYAAFAPSELPTAKMPTARVVSSEPPATETMERALLSR